jgi:hypothetical protein
MPSSLLILARAAPFGRGGPGRGGGGRGAPGRGGGGRAAPDGGPRRLPQKGYFAEVDGRGMG